MSEVSAGVAVPALVLLDLLAAPYTQVSLTGKVSDTTAQRGRQLLAYAVLMFAEVAVHRLVLPLRARLQASSIRPSQVVRLASQVRWEQNYSLWLQLGAVSVLTTLDKALLSRRT